MKKLKPFSWQWTVAFIFFAGYILPAFFERALYYSYTDDAYYYFTIARNIVDGIGTVFTPGYLTNGYQPFHQFFVTAFFGISKIFNADPLIYIRLIFAFVVSAGAFFLLHFIRPESFFIKAILALALTYYYSLGYYGMETIFVIPLMSYLCSKLSRKKTPSFMFMGLLTGILFLIRIDSMVITFPLLLVRMLFEFRNHTLSFCKLVLAGLVPITIILAYMLINSLFYGISFPVSGLAKTADNWNWHWTGLESIRRMGWQLELLVLITVSFTLFSFAIKRNLYLLLNFALVIFFYIQTSIRSDWPLWEWYLYPFAVLLILAIDNIKEVKFSFRGKHIVALGSLSIALFIFIFVSLPPRSSPLHDTAFEIKQFSDRNPGIYAMGDRAGIVGYLSAQPVVQLEGLVMDKQFLQTLRSTDKLLPLLKKYEVDFYIATNPDSLKKLEWKVKEPAQIDAGWVIRDTINWPLKKDITMLWKGRISNTTSKIRTAIFQVPKEEK